MKIKIRKATRKDISYCVSIDVESFGTKRKEVKRQLKRKIKDKTYTILVALVDNRIVGFICFQFRDWNQTSYLEILAVKREFRGKGIGTRLLNELMKLSKEKKVRRIFVDMDIDNQRVIKFYLRNDFIIAGFIKDFFKEKKDAVILSRKI